MTKGLTALIFVLLIVGFGLGIEWYSTNQKLSRAEQIVLQQTSTINRQAETIQSQTSSITRLGSDLAASQELLSSTRGSLDTTKRDLAEANINLAAVQSSLQSVQNTLQSAESTLQTTQNTLQTTQNTLQQYKDTWGSVVAVGVSRPRWWNFNPASTYASELVNNSKATDVTFAQLQDFLLKDKTDQNYYVEGDYTAYTYMCGDFAKDLHNNAEKAGIRSAWVGIKLAPSLTNPLGLGHAVAAFKTTDRGLIFIDDTGYPIGVSKPPSCDDLATIKKGQDLVDRNLTHQAGWQDYYYDMGKILDVEVDW